MGDLLELHSAAREGRLDDLKRLLSKGGVDLERADESGETPLYSASAAGHVDVVRVLVDAGAKFTGANLYNPDDDWGYWNPVLNVACAEGHTAVVKVLLEKGASLNVASETGSGPLLAACASKKAGVDMVRLLLEHGVHPDEGDQDGRTAIMHAIPSTRGSENLQRQLDKLKILIDSGADVNKPEYGGNTPLHEAVLSSLTDATILLLEHGADVHALNKRREVPLQVHYYLPPPYIILLLLDYDGGRAPCRKKKCGCGLTVDLCCYNHALRLNSGADFAGFAGLLGLNFDLHVEAFQIYGTRMKAAGLMPLEDSQKGVVETIPFWKECKEELARMKTEKVGDTNVAYINIWNRRPATLRQVEEFPPEVTLKFNIYENLIRRRYIMGRRKLPLMDKAQTFFSLLPFPKLLSECIDIILDFLSEDDLKSLADIVAASTELNKSKRPNEQEDEPLPSNKVLKAD